MKKIAIVIVILAILAGGLFFGYTKLKSIFGIEETKVDENGMKIVSLKKLPVGVKINFKVENSCEKPGHKAIKFSVEGLKSAGVKEFGYSFSYVNEDTGALQGNGTTTPIKVQNDSYKPMTANCNEYGLFSCSAGGKCVFYTVNKVEGEYKFYMGGSEIGVWKESYEVK